MKRLFLFAGFFLFLQPLLQAQVVHFFGGPVLSKLYNIKLNRNNYLTDYTNGFGYFLGYGVSIKNEDSILLYASMRIDRVSGGFNFVKEEAQARHNISGDFSKTTLGATVGFQPFKIMRRFETLAELQFNARLHTRVTGYDVYHNDTLILTQQELLKQDMRKFLSMGLGFSVFYNFYQKKDWEALIYYRLYSGITNEMKHTGTGMKLTSGVIGLTLRRRN